MVVALPTLAVAIGRSPTDPLDNCTFACAEAHNFPAGIFLLVF